MFESGECVIWAKRNVLSMVVTPWNSEHLAIACVHKNDTPSENTFSKTINKTSPITDTPPVPWGLMASFAYIAVPIILFLNVITHEEPGGSIAPTGLLNIPCFVLLSIPVVVNRCIYVNYLRDSTIT